MSRYIDADALKKDLSENYTFYGFRQLLNDFYEALDSAPSIDIVRCKECRYFSVISDEEEGTNYYMCGVWSNDTDEDAFCSFGKRKE